MKLSIRFIMILGMSATLTAGQDLTDPVEILKKADAACKAIEFIQYTASVESSGAAESRVGKSSGTVTLKGRKSGGGPEQGRYEAKLQKPGSSDVNEVTVGSDGKTYFVIDFKTKKVYEDIDPAVVGTTGRAARALAMNEYFHPEPYSDEINGKKQELKGTTKVGDEDCYEVNVEYSQAGVEATWFFSKKDFLPRRVDRRFQTPTGEKGGTQLIVTKLTLNPKLDKDPFKLVVPEGFTKIDDFAP